MRELLALILMISYAMGFDFKARATCFPSTTEVIKPFKVNFYLCTKSIGSCHEINNPMTKEELKNAGFHAGSPTYVLIHGFLRTHETFWVQDIKDILRQEADANVFLVDWSSVFLTHNSTSTHLNYLNLLNYRYAVIASATVAEKITEFMKSYPASSNSMKWRHLHFIGHSLGAHIAGQAARKLDKVHRITGLDPAGPCFENVNTNLKLRNSDARFVDVIHTNCEQGKSNNFGIFEKLGTVDFYPNGGNNQPGCASELPKSSIGNIFRMSNLPNLIADEAMILQKNLYNDNTDFKDLISNFVLRGASMFCDHEESARYFVESMKKSRQYTLYGHQYEKGRPIRIDAVTNCIEMGINADSDINVRGAFYVDTKGTFKECRAKGEAEFHEGLKRFNRLSS
ncbi:hypothetical protein QAD02_011283 [Eretmocerus hayati]|uniref:Uncharacterized protein n=1 Tax=Eretmocerus hayati TaxID=131215 RepID=A0ACC2NWN3_9HYME|nr:hypothetical protein QAD02_011283 [Eretmocerus hayati]